MVEDDLVERELTFNRFRKLILELLKGRTRRSGFLRWEVEILADIASCQIDRRRWAGILRQYLRAVERQLELGPGPPMKLSEFLQTRRTRRPSTR